MLKTMHAKSVTWTESPKLLLLPQELLMEKKSSWDAFMLPYSVLYPHPFSLFERLTGLKHISESVLFSLGQPLRKLYLAQRLHCSSLITYRGMQWRGATFALQFSYHYNQPSRCYKLPNETCVNVISAICQRTRRVWMWWLMSIWSHLTQRKAE